VKAGGTMSFSCGLKSANFWRKSAKRKGIERNTVKTLFYIYHISYIFPLLKCYIIESRVDDSSMRDMRNPKLLLCFLTKKLKDLSRRSKNS